MNCAAAMVNSIKMHCGKGFLELHSQMISMFTIFEEFEVDLVGLGFLSKAC